MYVAIITQKKTGDPEHGDDLLKTAPKLSESDLWNKTYQAVLNPSLKLAVTEEGSTVPKC